MYDTPSNGRFSSVATGISERQARLLLLFDGALLCEAFSYLALRDDGFEPITPEPPTSVRRGRTSERPTVALLDGNCRREFVRNALGFHRPVGGVMLSVHADTPRRDRAGQGPCFVEGVPFSVVGPATRWCEVAKRLRRAAKGLVTSAGQRSQLNDEKAENGHTDSGDGAPRLRADSELELYQSLSRREQELLAGLGAGNTPSQIAEQLHIAVSTAENHKSRLMKKINVHKSTELVRFAIRVGAAPL